MESQHQNVRFNDQTPQWDYVVDSMPDSTFSVADTDDATLSNFFSRPIKIQSFSWGTGTNLYEAFNPWQDFFENERVINRITNFNLLRCKLKVRIMLNGNGFYYGRAIASYVPLHDYDMFTKDRSFFIQDVVEASQRPHVFLDPTTSQGGTLTLPFVWQKNALSIPNQDWRKMGEIIIHGMQNLKHANGASGAITVSIFAWAEDVSLSIPTANEPGALAPQVAELFVPQARDEYGTGPISRPAGVIARAAGALRSIPSIAPYAKATELAANAVSSIATMFGYSRPVELADIKPYKPTYLGNMANTNVHDTSTKLTLDAKQELTVDPRVMGLGGADELSIRSIAQRESFLTQFGWEVAHAPEALLWNAEVSPVVWNKLALAHNEYHMPACCFASLPFRGWRGTMKYRFQIVASAFHKGRLKIVYDPSYPLTNEYNTNYTHIVDLAKERDFTIDIGWGSDRSVLYHRALSAELPYGTTKRMGGPGIYGNGIISVYVVNELTVPNSTVDNDIEINVFVSAGDDFEVFDPDSSIIEDLSWFPPTYQGDLLVPQMAEKSESHPDADLTTDEDIPMRNDSVDTLAVPLSQADQTLSVYYGDPIVSFRQCLKRYNWHSALAPPNDGTYFYSWILSNFPYYRGYAPGAIHTTLAGEPYNYCKMTLLNWVTPAYVCMRGAIRWKYMRSGGTVQETNHMTLTRIADSNTGNSLTSIVAANIGSSSTDARIRQANMAMPNTWDGGIATSTFQNPVLEAELPFYSNVRFFGAKWADKSASLSFNKYHRLDTIWQTTPSDAALIHAYCSVGEDFTLGFFTGAPVAYSAPPFLEPPSG